MTGGPAASDESTTDEAPIEGSTRRPVVIAVDVGGSSMKAGILGPSGVHELRRVPSERERGPEAVLATVIDVLIALLGRCGELGVHAVAAGVAVPGVVDDAGVGRYSVTMGWHDLDIRERISAALPLPVVVGHDVRSGAIAERTFGVIADVGSALFVPIGTGISAAVVVDGRIVDGTTFQAGEIGQLLVAAPAVGAAEGTGAMVTLEAICTARAIAERYTRAAGLAPNSIGAADVLALAAGDDPTAQAVWDEAVDRLGCVLAASIAVIDPAVVVVGGGLSRAGNALVDPLVESIAGYLPWRRPPLVTTARFADDAGFVGAAINGWDRGAGLDVDALSPPLGERAWTPLTASAA